MKHKFFIDIYPENYGFIIETRVYTFNYDTKLFIETDNKKVFTKNISTALALKKKLKTEYGKRLRARDMAMVQQQNQKALA